MATLNQYGLGRGKSVRGIRPLNQVPRGQAGQTFIVGEDERCACGRKLAEQLRARRHIKQTERSGTDCNNLCSACPYRQKRSESVSSSRSQTESFRAKKEKLSRALSLDKSNREKSSREKSNREKSSREKQSKSASRKSRSKVTKKEKKCDDSVSSACCQSPLTPQKKKKDKRGDSMSSARSQSPTIASKKKEKKTDDCKCSPCTCNPCKCSAPKDEGRLSRLSKHLDSAEEVVMGYANSIGRALSVDTSKIVDPINRLLGRSKERDENLKSAREPSQKSTGSEKEDKPESKKYVRNGQICMECYKIKPMSEFAPSPSSNENSYSESQSPARSSSYKKKASCSGREKSECKLRSSSEERRQSASKKKAGYNKGTSTDSDANLLKSSSLPKTFDEYEKRVTRNLY